LDVELNSPHLAAQQQQNQQQETISPVQITTAASNTVNKQPVAFTSAQSAKTSAVQQQQQSLVQIIPQAESNGQPVYFIQSTPTPTMIPLQFPQTAIPMQQLGAPAAVAQAPQANVISTIPVGSNTQPITIATVNPQNTHADISTTRNITLSNSIPTAFKVKMEGAPTAAPNMEFVGGEAQFNARNQSPFRIHSTTNYTVGGKDKSDAGPIPRPRMVRSYLDIEGM